MSLNGLVNVSALTHTKSNAEIDNLVLGYRNVRENAGEPKLLRLESLDQTLSRAERWYGALYPFTC